VKTVLLTDPISQEGEDVLKKTTQVVRAPDSSPETIRRLGQDADGVIIRSKLPDDIFEVAPRLKAVCVHGTGTDLVPLASATERGVLVANLPGANAQSVAEYCVLAMLMLARNIVWITSAMRTKPWDEARKGAAPALELQGATVGIIGVGEIGKRVARICRQGFGMNVLGFQRNLDRIPADAEASDLENLLKKSDYVVIAAPLNPATHHLINPKTLGWMKRTAWIVNVGRGAVIDESSLVSVLKEKRIAGAMLDVYEQYRIGHDHELFRLDNVILTPHLAGGTIQSRSRASVAAAREMLRMLSGERPLNFVNPDAWEAACARA
jgi:D-3-phosphoglycerate dehydrogenase